MKTVLCRCPRPRGFSLVEVAISLVLLGLAAVGVFAVLKNQIEQHRISETRDILGQSRDALLSYVTGYGRLPCPATAASRGVEAFAVVAGANVCTVESGFLPAVTLGMANIDQFGLLEGAWHDTAGSLNGTYLRAIRYSVTGLAGGTAHALTTTALHGQTRQAVQTSFTNNQGLFVCASITGLQLVNNRCGNLANTLGNNVAVIIWSLGADAADLGNYSLDEKQNLNPTVPRVVINRTFAPLGALNGQFDDQVEWIPYPVIADRLLYAGFVQ